MLGACELLTLAFLGTVLIAGAGCVFRVVRTDRRRIDELEKKIHDLESRHAP